MRQFGQNGSISICGNKSVTYALVPAGVREGDERAEWLESLRLLLLGGRSGSLGSLLLGSRRRRRRWSVDLGFGV